MNLWKQVDFDKVQALAQGVYLLTHSARLPDIPSIHRSILLDTALGPHFSIECLKIAEVEDIALLEVNTVHPFVTL